MPKIEELRTKQEQYNFLEKRTIDILKTVAEPYKELAKAEKIKEAVYEIPAGISERDAMALTLGAMYLHLNQNCLFFYP